MEHHTGWGAVRSLLRGLGAAVALTVAGMLALALAVVYAHLGDEGLGALNQALKLAALFAGAWVAVGRGGKRGFATGAVVGLSYIALGYGLCALGGSLVVSGRMLALEFLLGAGLGGLCGALAANVAPKRARRAAMQ